MYYCSLSPRKMELLEKLLHTSDACFFFFPLKEIVYYQNSKKCRPFTMWKGRVYCCDPQDTWVYFFKNIKITIPINQVKNQESFQ
uniref:Uncharacterized protein n=1 Tax=Hippocampus comes TaxID=109280 RepID=A0A3Q2XCP2_HIPCM